MPTLNFLNLKEIDPGTLSQEDLHEYHAWFERYIHTMQWIMVWMILTGFFILFNLKRTRNSNSAEK